MAYFVPTGSLRRLLVEARQRGVRVSLLIQGRTEYWWARWAEQVMVEELLEAGVAVWEFQESFLHAKVLVADDWTTVGSSNWDPFSLWLAMEANLLLKDADFAQSLKADLQRHMTPERASQRVTRSALGGLLHRPQRLLQRLMLSGVLWVLRAIR
jgi:cardiolipin synthase